MGDTRCMTMTQTFAQQYAAACKASADADAALTKALKDVTLTLEFQQLALARPESYAVCLRKIADIVETLPVLRAAVADANRVADALGERACFHCHGTGLYQAPTSYYTQGKPTCWKCSGTGERHTK